MLNKSVPHPLSPSRPLTTQAFNPIAWLTSVGQTEPGLGVILGALLLHVALGLVFARSSLWATVHAVLVLLAGSCWVLARPLPERAAYLSAYIAGCETLWRMSKADLPWELGKYAVVIVLMLGMLRNQRLWFRPLPLLFFLLLLPALVLPLSNVDFSTLRQQISFNLSGPLVLAVSVWYFSQTSLKETHLHWVFLAFLASTVGIATVILNGILTATELVFTFGSNAQLSGGFGPNHVAAALGFSALCSFHWALHKQLPRRVRVFLLVLLVYLLVQSALTFARGGFYMSVLALVTTLFYLLRTPKLRLKLLGGAALLLLAAYFLFLPALDRFTEGKFSKRYANTSTTGRDDIALGDLLVFLEHPIFGVGPGQTRLYRPQHLHYHNAAAHTEFTRLLSEHGLFGVAAIIVLCLMAVQHYRRTRTPTNRAFAASFIVWAFLFMLYYATRLALPSLAFGLSSAAILSGLPGRRDTQSNQPNRVTEPALVPENA